jgi:hypothetical protein
MIATQSMFVLRIFIYILKANIKTNSILFLKEKTEQSQILIIIFYKEFELVHI